MERFLILLTIAFTCFSFLASTAEAKRFGGGNSFGKQRSVSPQQPRKAPESAPSATSAPKTNKWLGPLAGLAIGAGLATLFSGGLGGAMGGAIGSILLAILAAAVVLFLINKFSRSKQAAMQFAGSSPQPGYATQSPPPSSGALGLAAAPATGNIPADFPVDSFLRGAKASFIRLQAANDRKDLNDIREYTTPEMFAEISMQMLERRDEVQITDVTTINAELLEAVDEGDLSIASVRFTGLLRENNGAPESVDEIWHVQRNLRDPKAGWLLSGIQQTNLQ
jgi:predicted lipid-binding transport protein (Tim44 family)